MSENTIDTNAIEQTLNETVARLTEAFGVDRNTNAPAPAKRVKRAENIGTVGLIVRTIRTAKDANDEVVFLISDQAHPALNVWFRQGVGHKWQAVDTLDNASTVRDAQLMVEGIGFFKQADVAVVDGKVLITRNG